MQPSVLAINEDVSVNEAIDMVTQLGVSSAPVVTTNGHPIGIADWMELTRYQHRAYTRLAAAIARPTQAPLLGPGRRFLWELAGTTAVRKAMNWDVRCISINAPLIEVVEAMLGHQTQRVFVVDEQKSLVGVVNALDVLRQLRR
jgi:CBS domain-containing protein